MRKWNFLLSLLRWAHSALFCCKVGMEVMAYVGEEHDESLSLFCVWQNETFQGIILAFVMK